MHATVGTSFVLILALRVGGLPVAEERKWYDLEDNEFQAVAKQLRTLKNLDKLGDDGLLSINFGRSPSTFITNDDGTYLFDVYRMVGPKEITHALLTPATGDPQAPPPPFQHPPSAVINAREFPELSTSEDAEASDVFPANTTMHRGSAVYILEALGKVHLRITDVKKLMAHRGLAY